MKKISLWMVTIWLSFVMTIVCEGQPTVNGSRSTATVQTNSVSTAITINSTEQTVKPNATVCPWCWIAAFLVFLGIIVWIFVKICQAINKIGHKGNNPPNNNGGTTGSVVSHGLTTVQPTMIIGVNDVDKLSCLTRLFDDVPNVPNGTFKMDGIGLWDYDGSVTDTSLGVTINYTGGEIYNYSIQYSTNLVTWKTAATVIGWVTTDVNLNPWVCQIVYTNITATSGYPVVTNWFNLELDQHGQPATLLVYGPTNQTVFIPKSPKQFYRLWCNTNDVVTYGP